MTSQTEMKAYLRDMDADALEAAVRVVRRRMKKPAGISTAAFCRALLAEASVLRQEAREIRG